jgi:hypothetical protein
VIDIQCNVRQLALPNFGRLILRVNVRKHLYIYMIAKQRFLTRIMKIGDF